MIRLFIDMSIDFIDVGNK